MKNSKKRVGIVTLNGYCNFGNRLQNYALAQFLKRNDCHVETVWSGPDVNLKALLKEIIIRFLPYNVKWKREKKFYNFTKRYLNKVAVFRCHRKKYDATIVGSDQVWNYNSVQNNPYLLTPLCDTKMLASYAASLGNSDFPEKYVDIYRRALEQYSFISVREDSGKNILVSKVGIDNSRVVVNIDPVFLLDSREWTQIEERPTGLKNDISFLLCYFLGGVDPEARKKIENYAKKKNMMIIDLMNPGDQFYISGPEEFVYLVHHASMVCTDSFHASVLSILFSRPFLVFRRVGELDKMFLRIRDLLGMFNIDLLEYHGEIGEIKYDISAVNKVLNTKRQEANAYLAKILSKVEGKQ